MSPITCQVQVVLDNISPQKSAAVRRALEPDNVDFPEGLTLRISEGGEDNRRLVFDFEGRENIKQLVGTVDEVLEHIQVALKVIG